MTYDAIVAGLLITNALLLFAIRLAIIDARELREQIGILWRDRFESSRNSRELLAAQQRRLNEAERRLHAVEPMASEAKELASNVDKRVRQMGGQY